jgi:outer membrane immunogenic protein
MRKVLVSLAAASVAIATPALANEARVEARGGVIWGGGDSEAIAGVAAGYDFGLGDSAFAGIELSGDKILAGNSRVSFGVGGRIGFKLGEAGKLYAVSTYQTKFCGLCDDSVSVGAGYQHALGGNLYAKGEYRRYIVSGTDGNVAGVGLGMRF